MEITREGDWHIFREETTKPLARFRADASQALMSGLAGIATRQRIEGSVIHITSMAVESTVEHDMGVVTVRVRFKPMYEAPLFPLWSTPILGGFWQRKVLSDIEAITRSVCENLSENNRDVFIAHGHNHHALTELKALLGAKGLRPVVLHEQDDRGMTIVEKFEHYASECAFAIVLMTPDDKGAAGRKVGLASDKPEERWRARQNVILELGWFMARLGRDRVMILYQGELEIPSDILGVVYVEFKDSVDEASERVHQRLAGVHLIRT